MSVINEAIVREFFELNGFLVRQHRKYVSRIQSDEDEIDFLVLNPRATATSVTIPQILTTADLPLISRAVVAVKGWHSDTFGPCLIANQPDVFRFVEPESLLQATRIFGDNAPVTKIMVIPALASGEEANQRSLELLREKGVDCVIPFPTLLADIINRVETNRNYVKSDLLQTIRILKNYRFFKGPQMELFKPVRKKKAKKAKTAPKPNTDATLL